MLVNLDLPASSISRDSWRFRQFPADLYAVAHTCWRSQVQNALKTTRRLTAASRCRATNYNAVSEFPTTLHSVPGSIQDPRGTVVSTTGKSAVQNADGSAASW